MNENIEQLRDLFADKDKLAKKRKEVKEKALSHRTEKSIIEAKTEIQKIDNELQLIELRIEKIQKENQNNKEKRDYMEENVNKRASIEYRKAFMNFVQKGEKANILEFRADANTTTTTAATVIPSTVLEEIIKISKISGNVLSKVRKLNIKGGLQVPTISVIPEASWITEAASSDKKALSTSSVTFSYYGLEVKISQTLLSEYVSISSFEREFAMIAVEAMTNAKEIAIFNGNGVGQPTGILKTSGIKSVDITVANFGKYDKLVAAIGQLPVGYRNGAEFFMNSGTWDMIVGMIDNNGQPVARVNYGLNSTTMTLFGYPVNLVESDRLKDLNSAVAGTDYFLVLGNMSKYAINSNGDLGVYKYRDDDKNIDVTKALEFLDGKVLDVNAFLALKKVAA